MSLDWRIQLASARDDYGATEYSGALPATTRLASARSLADAIARFDGGGAKAIDTLATALRDPDELVRRTAARILSALGDSRAASTLVAAFERPGPFLDERHLARLGKRHAAELAVHPLEHLPEVARAYVCVAIARDPGERGRAIVTDVLAGKLRAPQEAIVDALAARNDRDTLREIAARPPEKLAKGTPRLFALHDDAPAHAAFRLALGGDDEGLAILERFTRDSRKPYARPAVLRLGWLGLPRAIEPTARLLHARSLDAVEGALDAADSLATPWLTTPLIEVVEANRGAPAYTTGSLSADALDVLAELAGIDLPEGIERRRGLMRVRTALLDLDPARRYRRGRPLTLADLARDLASSHEGPRTRASWSLRAATGEDHGFDLDDDLAGNLVAIDAWTARASDPEPLGAGGWAYLGARIQLSTDRGV